MIPFIFAITANWLQYCRRTFSIVTMFSRLASNLRKYHVHNFERYHILYLLSCHQNQPNLGLSFSSKNIHLQFEKKITQLRSKIWNQYLSYTIQMIFILQWFQFSVNWRKSVYSRQSRYFQSSAKTLTEFFVFFKQKKSF